MSSIWRTGGLATMTAMSPESLFLRPLAFDGLVPFWVWGTTPHGHHLFPVVSESESEPNLAGTTLEKEAVDFPAHVLADADAPPVQFEGLGLA
jgi:hypothetical protein